MENKTEFVLDFIGLFYQFIQSIIKVLDYFDINL